jgi:preprotein translocase subunit Sss1
MLTIAIRTLETMFVLGIIGSAIVVILTSIEDFKTLFKKDNEP